MPAHSDVTRAAWKRLEALIETSPAPEAADFSGVPVPVRRYLEHAGVATTARAANIGMRGQIKLGRWLPFRSRQLLAPRLGTVWAARVAGVIVGSDRYVGGAGGMDWRILGVIPLVHSDGVDVTRSAAERAAGESIWVPSALAPPSGGTYTARDESHLEITFDVDEYPITLRHTIADSGALRSSSFDRWGDPDNTGTWRPLPFGVEVSREATFGLTTIPVEGRAGWHFGTERWEEGCFFRFQITDYEILA